MEYFEVITDAKSGEQTIRLYSQEEIKNLELSNLPTKDTQEEKRKEMYRLEADPLFFRWQANEATEEEWRVKRKEIRERYPYPKEEK